MDIVGIVKSQEKIANMLKNSYKQNRLSHAYLFYGEEGVGKKEMAYFFASLLYCNDGGCLECPSCQSIINNEHLNVHYIGVMDNKKLISKNQITDLQDEFSKTSLLDGSRIYIVDGIDTASQAAQNSLLKFIEEPVNNEPTYGIFLAKDKDAVVSTIVSRCSLVFFSPLSSEFIKKSLTDLEVSNKDAIMISILTNNINEAASMANNENYKKMISVFDNFINLKNGVEAILFYKENGALISSLDNLKIFLKWILEFHTELFLLYNMFDIKFKFYEKELNVWKKRYTYQKAKENYELILKMENRIDYNVLPKNILHQVIINLF